VTHRRTPSKRKLAALVALPATALAVALPVGFGLMAGHRHQRDAAPHAPGVRAADPSARTGRRHPGSAGPVGPTGPLVPRLGAYLGAYVQPASYTWQAQVAAVRSFDKQIGAKLDLIHVYHPWSNPFPSQADRDFVESRKVLLLTWGGTPDTKKIIAGDYDTMIMARAEAVKELRRPILMEFRHEMDRPNLQWAVHGPRDYIRAWDHIRAIFTRVGATNVGWVWCPTGYGFQDGRAQAFYPGNAEVDWVCADVYAYSPSQSLQQAAAPFMRWAARTKKPVIIGEFAVNGSPSAWPGWLAAVGRFARTHPQIKAMAYFDANGEDSNGNPFSYWLGDHLRAIREFARLVALKYFRPAIGPGQL
jgi:hypothetical protein